MEVRRSSDQRAQDRKAAAEELRTWRDADLRRHDEAMTALRALISRTAPPGSLGQAD